MHTQARILVVSNQKASRHTMARKLEKNGYEANSSDVPVAEAMCIGDKRPDLVLIDLQGEGNDTDLTSHLRLATNSICFGHL